MFYTAFLTVKTPLTFFFKMADINKILFPSDNNFRNRFTL